MQTGMVALSLLAVASGARAEAAAAAPPAPAASAAAATPQALPTWAELEAAGARIGRIRILNRNIFDTEDPAENKLLFRWANALHVQTRRSVIERALLFKSGDPVTVRLIDESERVLRNNRFLYDVEFRVVAVHDGVVDIDVLTRDTWTLDLGASAGRAGGTNTSGIHLREYNLLGTGMSLSVGHSNAVDRSGNDIQLATDRAFGTWTAVSLSHGSNSDGRRDAVSVVRPFYALDARWSAGAALVRDDRIDPVYRSGEIVSQYRRRQDRAELSGGRSRGLVDGWVQRWSLGLEWRHDAYAPEPGLVAPSQLPADQRLLAPFVRYELIEDRYDKQLNRDLIGKPEFFALGLNARVQLGWAASAWGSTQDTLLYAASISRGFVPAPGHRLFASAAAAGQLADGELRRARFGAQAQYYLPQSRHWLFYASAAADALTRPDPAEMLQLGGETGLRGFPLRYQSGTRRALFTTEERFYTDLYVWRLFRVGGAAFFDAGRAWGGEFTNTAHPGWLANAGFGLRIVTARAAFSNVLHLDIAFPLNAPADIRKVQFLVNTQATF